MNTFHTPVLLKESIKYLVTDPSGIYFDGTLGFGGHSEAILNKLNDKGTLIATDVDKDSFTFSKNKFKDYSRVRLYNFNFLLIDSISKIESVSYFDGIFADLGVSSFQLDNPSSGFTYRTETKLDLRMDKSRVISAADIVNSFSEEEIANIIFKYGEEKNSRNIARSIISKRRIKKIETTTELREAIEEVTSEKYLSKTLSRVFQALRIYVNDELETLKSFLTKAVDLLKVNGRIVIISYHSLEDRIVKDHFKYETLDCICPKDFPVCKCDKEKRLNILTKKPLTPTVEEVNLNLRARSAKLRAAERL
ncbi:MAG: 16S rRNA (cytosine(1402)-N(4))-methyltransferase RsmH [Ignavibacteria bacterium]|nr:16S rRNA (cytosine(1402)-N(4))-methyltransferase RsmH [Ignavibacteria bacterium]